MPSSDPQVPYPTAMARFPTLRQSRLASFDQCSLLSKFERDYAEGWSQPWQGRGILLHRFCARALAEMYREQQEQIEVDVALAIFEEVLRQDDIDRKCPHCGSDRIRRGVTKDGRRYCLHCKRRFPSEFVNVPSHHVKDLRWVVKKWAYDNAFSIAYLVDIEHRLSATVAYPNPYGGVVERTLTGKLDALMLDEFDDTHAIVIDWKDTWGMPGPSEVSEEGFFQQRWYALLVMLNYRKIERVTMREFYVRYSEPREATVSRDDLDSIIAEFAALVERFDRSVEEKIHRPTPGWHCGYCPTPHRCPIKAEARGTGRITDFEEAKLVAATLVVGRQIVKQNREALAAWCRTRGEVPVKYAKGKRVFGFLPQTRTYSPKPEEIEAEERAMGRPLSAAEVKALYRVDEGTRFADYTPKPETLDEEELLDALRQSVRSES